VKSLSTLLKLARRQLETLRVGLAGELTRLRQIEDELAAHDHALLAEQALAFRDQDAALAYPPYALRAKRERTTLEARRTSIAVEIDRLRALIAEAHIEARKFERLIELQNARLKAAQEKREDSELDELATQRAGRRG
jgi:flagellar biosynthesis chaperone FliJ